MLGHARKSRADLRSTRLLRTSVEDQFGVVGDVDVDPAPVLVPVDGTVDPDVVVPAPELVAPSVVIVPSLDVVPPMVPEPVVPEPIVSEPVVPPIVPVVPPVVPPIVPVLPVVPVPPIVPVPLVDVPVLPDVVEPLVVELELVPDLLFFIFLSAFVDWGVVPLLPAVCAIAAVGTSSAAAARVSIMRIVSSPRLLESQRLHG